MGTPVEAFLLQAIAQEGDVYRYGAEVDFADPNPDVWDCSELLQWSGATCVPAVRPAVPDGSWLQFRAIARAQRTTSIVTACRTRGACLFRFGSDPLTGGRPAGAHVALSLGDGSTVEARGSKWGVGSWTSDPAARGWTHAGLLPGVDYHSITPSFRTLRIRSPYMRGVDVEYVQVAMNLAAPVGQRSLVIDGIYGRNTRAAVVQYQGGHGLIADGIVGPNTWRSITG